MGKATSLLSKAYMVEKEIELPTASGRVAGPTVGAGTLVIAAGVELIDAVDDVTSYTVAVADDTTTFMAATSVDAATAGTFVYGTQTQAVVAASDTIDAVAAISGSPAASTARVWAIVVDVNEATRGAAEVDRDTLA
jgi:hypothetical protein